MDYTEYRFDVTDKKDFWFWLASDLHADSESFAKELFINDAEKAKKRDARFLFNGDIFDGILPTDRKRYSRSSDMFKEDAQINERVEYVYDLLKPYTDHIDFIGIGNHEASIVKYDHADMVKMLVHELNLSRSKKLDPIQRGSYQGFLRLRFLRDKSKMVRSFDIYRDHGKGGAAPVTKGVINIQRLHTTFVADLYWLGHTHSGIVDTTPWTIAPNGSGKIIKKRKLSVITAGYHDCFTQRNLGPDDYYRSSFPEEKFLTPSSMGSSLLRLEWPGHNTEPGMFAEIVS